MRENTLLGADGFLGMRVSVSDASASQVTVSTHWSSVPAYEAWACSAASRRLHLPSGVCQYVPHKVRTPPFTSG